MNAVNILSGENISVSVNGEKLPLVESIAEECAAAFSPVYVFGEDEAHGFAKKGRTYTLKITRLPGASLPEDFTLTLDDGEELVAYYGCVCTKYERIIGVSGSVKEIITVSASGREVVS